ncbi:MAG: PIN domain-containing protein [Chitinophagales bacterium]
MKIIVDTNILMSSILNSESRVGQMLINELDDIPKYSSYFLFVEIFDKKEKIIKYSRMEEEEVLELLFLVLKKIQFVNESQISDLSFEKARELTEDIDVKDIGFVALTIELEAILWTGDKKLYRGLKAKGFENVVNLEDLREMLGK